MHSSRALNWCAIPALVLATFSQGNGIAMFFILTAYQLIKGDKKTKARLRGFLCVKSSVVFF